jgi:hypothetical protein
LTVARTSGAFLFGREDITETLAAVLTYEPDLTKLPSATPPAIKRLLAHCLTKDKRQRLDSMTAARIEIEDEPSHSPRAMPQVCGRSALFRIPLNDITRSGYAPYGVKPDGQRFLLNVPDRPTPLFFLQGLDALVSKK